MRFERKTIFKALVWLGGLSPLLGIAFLVVIARFGDLPNTETLANPRTDLATRVYSADGKILGSYYRENRADATYEDLPQHLVNALVATEDARFYKHDGVDFYGLARAIAFMGKRGGGSTITQQLAKNLFLWSGRSWSRKVIELYFTFLIEIIIPKRRILEIYLNTVETSLLTFGVNQASDKYYKKPANKLTREQSVRIALTLPNPKTRSPKKLKSNLAVRISRLKKDINILKKDDRSSCFL